MNTQTCIKILALLFTLSIIGLGYVMLGIIPMFLFTFGFLGGFMLWIKVPTKTEFSNIKLPFYLTLLAFFLHKVEERQMNFFQRLSEITNVQPPPTDSILVYLLYILAGAWLLIPYLVKKQNSFGYYLAWTFFTSMGIIELAHFVFPFFIDKPYRYFPGMATVFFLAPLGWWGMFRLSKKNN